MVPEFQICKRYFFQVSRIPDYAMRNYSDYAIWNFGMIISRFLNQPFRISSENP